MSLSPGISLPLDTFRAARLSAALALFVVAGRGYAWAQTTTPAPAAPSATSTAPAPASTNITLPVPGMTGPLAFSPTPFSLDLGPLGQAQGDNQERPRTDEEQQPDPVGAPGEVLSVPGGGRRAAAHAEAGQAAAFGVLTSQCQAHGRYPGCVAEEKPERITLSAHLLQTKQQAGNLPAGKVETFPGVSG